MSNTQFELSIMPELYDNSEQPRPVKTGQGCSAKV